MMRSNYVARGQVRYGYDLHQFINESACIHTLLCADPIRNLDAIEIRDHVSPIATIHFEYLSLSAVSDTCDIL